LVAPHNYAATMSTKESQRLTLDLSKFGTRNFGNGRKLAATTLAIAKGNFVKEKFGLEWTRGMI
jgi:hypothetical protein